MSKYDCPTHKLNFNHDIYKACPRCTEEAIVDRATNIGVDFAVSRAMYHYDEFLIRQHNGNPATEDELINSYRELAEEIRRLRKATPAELQKAVGT